MPDPEFFKLTYFDTHGRGLQIRLLFHIAGTDYEDHRVTRADWRPIKPDTPWGHIPVLQHGELTLFDSCAIVAYIAEHVGLWPEDAAGRARSIALINAADEVFGLLAPLGSSKNPIKLLWLARRFVVRELPDLCARFDAQLAGNYFLGDALSAVDVSVFALFSVILDRGRRLGTPRIVARHERLQAFIDRVAARDDVSAYLDDHPDQPIR